jgi:hypothetical protein
MQAGLGCVKDACLFLLGIAEQQRLALNEKHPRPMERHEIVRRGTEHAPIRAGLCQALQQVVTTSDGGTRFEDAALGLAVQNIARGVPPMVEACWQSVPMSRFFTAKRSTSDRILRRARNG